MKDREPYEEEFEELLRRDASCAGKDFDEMWSCAEGEVDRLVEMRKRRFYFCLVGSLSLLIVFLSFVSQTGEPVSDKEQAHFCARDAVDDWFTMMESEFYRGFPSDQFLNP